MITSEMSRWLKQVRESWFGELDTALPSWGRFIFAAGGAGLFVSYQPGSPIVAAPGDARLLDVLDVLEPMVAENILYGVLVLIIVVWVGVIVAWRKRQSGPVRLFFDGILVPTAAAAILRLGQ